MTNCAEELAVDEGCVHKIYLDHLGLKTLGIGHLCREGESEYDMEVDTPVSEERVNELFDKDIAWTVKPTAIRYYLISICCPSLPDSSYAT